MKNMQGAFTKIFLPRDRNEIPVLVSRDANLWIGDFAGDPDFCAAYESFQWIDNFGNSSNKNALAKKAAVFGKDDSLICTKSL